MAEAVTRRGFRIGQSAIGNIESGRVKHPKCIVELAWVLDVLPSWLTEGTEPKFRHADFRGLPFSDANPPAGMQLKEGPRVPYRAEMPRDVIVFGTVSGGTEDADFEMNGEVVDTVRRPPRLAARSDVFALYLQGSSMSPWRDPGQLVYVEKAKAPRPMDYVVVELKSQPHDELRPALVKRLLAITPTKLKLRQYNPPKDFEIERRRVGQIYRVMDWDELMGV